MKNLFLFVTLIALLVVTNNSYAQYANPESVVYDSTAKRYLISNTSNGIIKQRTLDGTVTDFVTGATSCRGMAIYGGKLFVACGTVIRGYNLSDAASLFSTTVSGSQFLNGMDVDASGMLYISDFNARRIYKFNTATQAYWIYVSATTTQPNGICVDAPRNRVLFCNWGGSAPVKSINLTDSSVTTVASTSYSNCDGIKMDRNNNVYVSTWGGGGVIKFDVNFTNPAVQVISGLSNPADIYVNKKSDTLASPNAGNNTVTFHFLNNPVSVGNNNTIAVKDFNLYQNYPNPFNPSTTISFNLAAQGFVNLSVYDINGKKVSELLNEKMNAGFQSVSFNAVNLPSGIYTYKLITDERSISKNMVLIK